MLSRIFLAGLCASGLSACATKPPVAFSPGDACSELSTAYEKREIQCQLPKSGFNGKLRFTVNFSGGHDDTAARLETAIDDMPLTCDEGSKVHLVQEDGDVSLWCDFAVASPLQGNGVLKVVVKFSHAEYVNYEFVGIGGQGRR